VPNKLGGYRRFSAVCVNEIPIRTINFDNPDDNAKCKKVVSLVELSSKKVKENNPNTLRLLETQIKSTDRQIDNLVYDLSPEEIELVEQSTS
jgi:hypothetical protein